MTTPNRVTEMEEKIEKAVAFIVELSSFGSVLHRNDFKYLFDEIVAEAEARGRQQAVEYIQENSTGVIVGRTENDVPILGHWILKPETLEAALTNHTV